MVAARGEAVGGDRRPALVRRWAWGTALILALIVLATWDMVFKPGLT